MFNLLMSRLNIEDTTFSGIVSLTEDPLIQLSVNSLLEGNKAIFTEIEAPLIFSFDSSIHLTNGAIFNEIQFVSYLLAIRRSTLVLDDC